MLSSLSCIQRMDNNMKSVWTGGRRIICYPNKRAMHMEIMVGGGGVGQQKQRMTPYFRRCR